MGTVASKQCTQLMPGTLEHNRCDGSSPAWFSIVIKTTPDDVVACRSLQLRNATILIASNVYRGMWRTLWEP